MTFPRVNPTGWTDDISTIIASQINQIDINLTRALDGFAGGLYAPSAPLIVNGSGFQSDNILNSTLNGDLDCVGDVTINALLTVENTATLFLKGGLQQDGNDGRIIRRADFTTLGDADADITVAYDHWAIGVSLTADRTYTLRHTLAGVIPREGDVLHVTMLASASYTYYFEREDSTIVAQATTPPGPTWVRFINDGSGTNGWRCKAWHNSISNISI